VAEAAIACGVNHIRLTGGEPLLREDLPQIVRRLACLAPGLDLAITTNGSLLAEQAGALAEAGLVRANVSLDSLRGDRFSMLTGSRSREAVLAGLEAARQAGLSPIKVNVVVVRGVNEDETLDMVKFAQEQGCEIRFIEFMPLDGRRAWLPDALVPADEIRGSIEPEFRLTRLPPDGSPGDRYLLGAGPTRVSLIGAVSRPFCERCNRMRVTADGFLRPCLFGAEEYDLRPALRAGDPRRGLMAAFAAAAARKPLGHRVGRPGFCRPARAMFAIGG